MFKQLFFGFLFFYSLLHSPKALTGNDWRHDIKDWSHETQDFSKDLYERALLFAPEILSPKDSLSHPYIKINGKKVYLNSAFWRLVKGWLRVYQEEINSYCACEIDPEALAEKARDFVYQGYFQSKTSKLKEIIGLKAIDSIEMIVHLTAQYGNTALVLTGAAEVAETIAIGNHIVCKFNNALVLFMVQPIQAFARVLGDSKTFNQNRLLMMARRAWINHAVNKAQKKVFVHLESLKIENEGLHLVNQEGPKDKREQWIQKVTKKAAPLLEKIAEIDRKLEESNLSERKRKKLLKRKRSLVEKTDSLTKLGKESYLGERYGWLLGLISRKGKEGYLKGHALPDEVTSLNWLWVLAASENIMERAFIRKVTKEPPPGTFREVYPALRQTEMRLLPSPGFSSSDVTEEKIQERFIPLPALPPPLREDPIRKGLAREYSEKLKKSGLISDTEEHIKFTEQILTDVEEIFNPSLSMKERYIIVSKIQMTLNSFFSPYMEMAYQKMIEGKIGLWTRIKLRYTHSRFYYYTTRYSAFMLAASVTKNKASLISYKYESMESLLSFFEYLIDLREIESLPNKEEMLSRLKENIRRIETLRPYEEKKSAFNLFGLPLCQDLVRRTK